MNCPRCEKATLEERDRDGVTLDVCTGCRGLWLDRGELEKLIARTTAELDDLERGSQRRHGSEPPRQPQQYRKHDSDYPRHRRKRSWMESLGDIFD